MRNAPSTLPSPKRTGAWRGRPIIDIAAGLTLLLSLAVSLDPWVIRWTLFETRFERWLMRGFAGVIELWTNVRWTFPSSVSRLFALEPSTLDPLGPGLAVVMRLGVLAMLVAAVALLAGWRRVAVATLPLAFVVLTIGSVPHFSVTAAAPLGRLVERAISLETPPFAKADPHRYLTGSFDAVRAGWSASIKDWVNRLNSRSSVPSLPRATLRILTLLLIAVTLNRMLAQQGLPVPKERPWDHVLGP